MHAKCTKKRTLNHKLLIGNLPAVLKNCQKKSLSSLSPSQSVLSYDHELWNITRYLGNIYAAHVSLLQWCEPDTNVNQPPREGYNYSIIIIII